MASIGDLFLRLLLDDADFQKNVVASATKAGNRAGQSMGAQIAAGISKSSTSIGKSLASVGQEFTRTGRSLTTNLTLPILAAGGAVSHFALDFDTSMRKVVGLTDVTAEEIDGIKEKVLAMAHAVGKAPNELAEAFYFVASAGFKAEEAMKVLEVAAKASGAGLGDTQTIAQVLGSVINAYGKENMTAAHAADILTESVSQGTAEASEFAGVLGRVVPIAASLGVGFDEVGAALAGMTLSGVGADEAATSLRQILVSLLKPTSEAEDALSAMGTSSAKLRQELREKGLLATLRDLEQRFGNNADATAKVFGNVRALAGIQNLLGLNTEQLNEIFSKVTDSTGRYGEAFDNFSKGPGFRLNQAIADLQVTAIQLGDDVLPMVVDVLGQIAAGARALGKWWRSLDDDTKKSIVQWLAWAAVAGPVLILIGKLATGLGALFKVVGFLAGTKGIPLLITKLGALRLAGLAALGPLALLYGLSEIDIKVGKVDKDYVSDLFRRRLFGDGEAVAQGTTAMTRAWAEAWAKVADITTQGGFIVERGAEEIPREVAAVLRDGAFVVEDAAEEMADPIAEALQKAKVLTAAAANDIIHTLATILFNAPADLKAELDALEESLVAPYVTLARRAGLEAALASSAVRKGLTADDPRTRAETAEMVKGWLAQYELLGPGALAAGELVNPALLRGINSNLGTLTSYLETTALPGILNPFDIADELSLMGYASLAQYVLAMALADFQKGVASRTAIVARVKADLGIDLYPEGYDTGASFARGLAASKSLIDQKAAQIRNGVLHFLEFAGSPPFTRSREAGEGAGRSWIEELVGAIRSAMPAVAGAVTDVVGALGLTPSALAFASAPAMGSMVAASPSSADVVNNTWNLTVNGVSYAFGSRDDFIKALDDLSSFGDGRL